MPYSRQKPQSQVAEHIPLRDPCKKFACAIQHCLKAHQYQESLCQYQLDQMIHCCTKWTRKSASCAGFTKQVEEHTLGGTLIEKFVKL